MEDSRLSQTNATKSSHWNLVSEEAAPSWPAWYRWCWVGALVITVCSFIWVHWLVGGEYVTLVFTDVVVTATAIVVPVALVRLFKYGEQSTRLGWGLITLGAGFEALGELSWAIYELGTGSVPYPGIPDFFYLAGYPMLALGLVLLTSGSRRLGTIYRLWLDGLIVGGALLTVSWYLLLGPILATSSFSSFDTWVTMAYPILDFVIGSIAFVVAMNTRGSRRVPMLLIASGIFMWVAADSMFAYLEFTGGYVFSELDTAWVMGNLAITLGALHPAATKLDIATDRRRYEFGELIAPYGPFVVAMALVGYLGVIGQLHSTDVLLGAFVLLALLLRQTYVFHDASRLSRELDEKEAKLEQRNEELLLLNQIVRHDIRNDMAVALGWGQELRNHVSEDGKPMLDRVLRTTQHTVDLTETLRDFIDSLESDGASELVPVALRPTLTESIERRREAYPDATFSVLGEIPVVNARATPLLSCVFRNILNNAVQHNKTADPQIEVSVEATETTVEIRFADNGPGIPPDQRDVVFGRDEKGLESAGSGVGLYLVDTLVTQFNGDVWIEANEPTGAIFVVELPRY